MTSKSETSKIQLIAIPVNNKKDEKNLIIWIKI